MSHSLNLNIEKFEISFGFCRNQIYLQIGNRNGAKSVEMSMATNIVFHLPYLTINLKNCSVVWRQIYAIDEISNNLKQHFWYIFRCTQIFRYMYNVYIIYTHTMQLKKNDNKVYIYIAFVCSVYTIVGILMTAKNVSSITE